MKLFLKNLLETLVCENTLPIEEALFSHPLKKAAVVLNRQCRVIVLAGFAISSDDALTWDFEVLTTTALVLS